MLDSIIDIKITLKSHFLCKKRSLCTQRYYGCHFITCQNLKATSGLSTVLMHGVISLTDTMSYDKFLTHYSAKKKCI